MAFSIDDEPTDLWRTDFSVMEKDKKLQIKGMEQRTPTVPPCPEQIKEAIAKGFEFHAFNAAFEEQVWDEIMVKRYGWPAISHDSWRCTQFKASYANQPRNLKDLGLRLGCSDEFKKADKGKELIERLCIPQRLTAAEEKRVKDANGGVFPYPTFYFLPSNSVRTLETAERFFWNEDPTELRELGAYCKQDVVAEKAVSRKLPQVPDSEVELYLLDRQMNRKGMPIDKPVCDGGANIYKECMKIAEKRLQDLTVGEKDVWGDDLSKVQKASHAERMKWYVHRRGFWCQPLKKTKKFDNSKGAIPSAGRGVKSGDKAEKIGLDAVALEDWIEFFEERVADSEGEDQDAQDCLTVLETRRDFGSYSATKYASALAYMTRGDDGNWWCLNPLIPHGGATGRWTAKGFHPHNFKRKAAPHEVAYQELTKAATTDTKTIKEAFKEFSNIGSIYGAEPTNFLKEACRGIVKAPPGYTLIISDFAGIEARVLHWLVGNQKMIDMFLEDQDIYIDAACDIYGVKPEEIATWDEKKKKWKILEHESEKRQIGKQAQLGLGYQMGAATFVANVKKQANMVITEEFAGEAVDAWRKGNKEVVAFWYKIEDHCRVIAEQGKEWRLNKRRSPPGPRPCNNLWINYGHVGTRSSDSGYLKIKLPSGRELHYYRPELKKEEGSPFGPAVHYLDGSKGKNGQKYSTYGGKLTENVVQAISRDLLVNSAMICRDAGMVPNFHVHDELVAVVPESEKDHWFKVIHGAMQTVPEWAKGLPLAAETHINKRYTK